MLCRTLSSHLQSRIIIIFSDYGARDIAYSRCRCSSQASLLRSASLRSDPLRSPLMQRDPYRNTEQSITRLVTRFVSFFRFFVLRRRDSTRGRLQYSTCTQRALCGDTYSSGEELCTRQYKGVAFRFPHPHLFLFLFLLSFSSSSPVSHASHLRRGLRSAQNKARQTRDERDAVQSSAVCFSTVQYNKWPSLCSTVFCDCAI